MKNLWWFGLVLSGFTMAITMFTGCVASGFTDRRAAEGYFKISVLACGMMLFCLVMLVIGKNDTK